MSGVFLLVWDSALRDRSLVLRPTRGGYPHITLAYSGEHLGREQLVGLAARAQEEFALMEIELSTAYVNSFDAGDRMRHDVLVGLGNTQAMRAHRARHYAQLEEEGSVIMRDLHVTHAIFDDRKAAEECALRLNKLLPAQVQITGVTIN